MTLDRTKVPMTGAISDIDFIEPIKTTCENGVDIYNIVAGEQDIIKIDFIFKSGLWYSDNPLVSGLTGAMLKEGTKQFDQNQIAEVIDFYGAYLNFSPGYDTSLVSLLTLRKHLEKVLPIVKSVITEPIFPEKELKIVLERRRQRFLQEVEKVANLSQRRFWNELFGASHPYSPNSSVKNYDNVDRSVIESFYNSSYGSDRMDICISGKCGTEDLEIIKQWFGEDSWGAEDNSKERNFSFESPVKKIFVEKEGSVQNCITVGRSMPGRYHEDHHGLKVLNVLLGGYFGSRLNKNIREDKGYTYGINSSYSNFLNGSAFLISTEVGVEYTDDTIVQIGIEFDRIKSELVSSDELEMVKNYMLGRVMRGFDGPFAKASSFHILLEAGLSYQYYRDYVDNINSITAEDIMRLANRYLNLDDMLQVVAGSR